jgi:hypothetical protein
MQMLLEHILDGLGRVQVLILSIKVRDASRARFVPRLLRSFIMVLNIKFLVPLYPAGQEPPPPGIGEEELPAWEQQKKMEKYMSLASESCIFKSTLAGGMGELFFCFRSTWN